MDNWAQGDDWELGLALLVMLIFLFVAILSFGYGLQYTVMLIMKEYYPTYPVIVYWLVVIVTGVFSVITKSGEGLVIYYFSSPVLLALFMFGRRDRNKKIYGPHPKYFRP